LLLAACGKSGAVSGDKTARANVKPPGEFPICKEPITIQVGIAPSAFVEDYETDDHTVWFKEKRNFKLNFDLFSANVTEAREGRGDGRRRRGGFTEEGILNMGMEGAVIPLNDYYEHWAYYIKDVLTKVDNKDSGVIEPVYTKIEWREGLRYINRLVKKACSRGRISPWTPPKCGSLAKAGMSAIGVVCGGGIGTALGSTNPHLFDYAPLPPLTGPGGVCYTPCFPAIPEKIFVITKSAKNPEAIFRWGDLICSEEGYMRMRFGTTGVDRKRPEPGAKSPAEAIGIKAAVLPILIWGAVQNSRWFHAVGIIPLGVTDGQAIDESNPLLNARWHYTALPGYIG
jgi:hypothetical protein